jgi:tetratricopeptide (TPR) repeat protein
MNDSFRFGSVAMRRLSALAQIIIVAILGAVECTAQSATNEISSPVILPANTSVILHLKENLYKKDAKAGHSLKFEVGYDVVLNGQVLIQSGTDVNGSARQVNRASGGPPKVLIDLGSVRTVSGEMVRLVSSSFSSNQSGGIGNAISWGAEAPPIIPALVIASLFEKKILLDKDAWGGVWGVVQTAENVALDPAKQKAAQEQYVANRKAARAELCELLASPDSSNWERIGSLARRSWPGDSNKAAILRRAGDLNGAIDVYQQLLGSTQDLPCSDKHPEISSGAFLLFPFALPEQREQLSKFFSTNSHLELAGLYREKRDFVHAISECRTAAQLDPKDERTRIALISTLQDSGDLEAAIGESKEAIRDWPDNPYLHYLLGRLLVEKNDQDTAIVELQWALKKENNHLSPANCALGRAFELKGDLKAALDQYRVAVKAHGGDQQCHAAYERLLLQRKN